MYKKRWRVDRFYTFPVFLFGSLLKSILDHLGLDFGVVWGAIFYLFSDPRGDQKFNDFLCCFFAVFVRFWVPS